MATRDKNRDKKANDKASRKDRRGAARPSGLEEALGVGVAAVAMIAGAGVSVGRSLQARRRPGSQQRAEILPLRSASKPKVTGIKAWLRKVAQRVPPFDRALDVQERYGDLHGNNLAAAVTFQAFVSLFPLLLVGVAVVGLIAGSGTNVAAAVIRELGLNGDAARAVTDAVATAKDSKKVAGPIGLASLFWSGLGLVNALQYAYDQVWQVEERGLKDKAIGVLWLGGAVVVFVAAAALTTILQWLPGILAPLGIAVALGVNFALWCWTSKILPNTRVPWSAVIPGAVLGAIGFELLKAAGAYWVPRTVASSSQLYGALGVVSAILAWLFFFGRLIVYSATLNVILWERREGTVKVVTEVPKQPGAETGEQVSRMGRLEAS